MRLREDHAPLIMVAIGAVFITIVVMIASRNAAEEAKKYDEYLASVKSVPYHGQPFKIETSMGEFRDVIIIPGSYDKSKDYSRAMVAESGTSVIKTYKLSASKSSCMRGTGRYYVDDHSRQEFAFGIGDMTSNAIHHICTQK